VYSIISLELDRVLKSEHAVIEGEGDKWEAEYRFRKADGTYATVVDRSLAMKDETGKVVKMIGSMKDITLKKQEEERIKVRFVGICGSDLHYYY
jgi:PAS domain S-box-containing protein